MSRTWNKTHPQLIFLHSIIEPNLELCWQKPKNQIHGSTNQLHCRLAQPSRPCSLPPKIIIQTHVIRKSKPGVIDLREVGNKLALAIYRRLNLVQHAIEYLREVKKVSVGVE